MRKKGGGILFLLLAVVFALAAAAGSVMLVRQFNETKVVVVAVKDVPPYTRVTKEDVKEVEFPAAAVPEDAVRRVRDVEGKYFKAAVLAGEPVRKARLADVLLDRGLMSAKVSALNEPGIRAFALPYDAQAGVGGTVREGDRIDIVASVKIDSPSGSVGVGKIIARNVLVLQVGKAGEGDKGTVVVALTPQQIEDIAFALTSGQVRFALNPYQTDEKAAETSGVTGQAWLERYGFRFDAPQGGQVRR